MFDLTTMGKLIANERNRQGWSQRQFREKLAGVGFTCTDGYIGRVESGASPPSRDLLIACEKAFGEKRGRLLMYSILAHVEKYCNDTGINLQDYMNWFGLALKSVVAPYLSPQTPAVATPGGSVRPGSPRSDAPQEAMMTEDTTDKMLPFFGWLIPLMAVVNEVLCKLGLSRKPRQEAFLLSACLTNHVRQSRRVTA